MTNDVAAVIQQASILLQQDLLLQQSPAIGLAIQQLRQQCYAKYPYQRYNQREQLIISLQQLPAQLNCNTGELARLVILKLLAEFSVSSLPLSVTTAIIDNYKQSLSRIYQLWHTEAAAEQQVINDKFLKDIGLLTGALLPCAERVVEPFSAIQRSLLYGNGFTQAVAFIRALIAAQGNKPVCRLHIHLSEINQLTAAGWRQTCQQLANLLLLNPKLKGVVGACWFYDPAITTVSPNLAFISDLLSEMQASWFFSHNEGDKSGAFSRSATRKQAYATGRYQPKNYVIFIPRNRLLAWYKRQSN